MAKGIVIILDEHLVDKVICMGDGVGADICTLFAITHPARCIGLMLIRPDGSLTNLDEQLSYISNGLDESKAHKLNEVLFAYLVWQRYGLRPRDSS